MPHLTAAVRSAVIDLSRLSALIAAALISGCATLQSDRAVEAPADSAVAGVASVPSESLPAPAPKQDSATRTAPGPRRTVALRIAAVGDIMLGTDYPENHLPDDDGVSFLAAVADTLQEADVAFGNLEGVLMDGGEPRKECDDPDSCFLFRSPSRYAQYLRAAGFDVMSLANNHARDFGEEGRTASMAVLDQAGIRHSGREGDVASWEVRGARIAVIAFSTTAGSHSLLDIGDARQRVRELASSHDIVLVSFHGGAEGLEATHVPFEEETSYAERRGDVVRFARAMVDAGAHLVVGHGPHVPRAMELYKGRLIAYSLGNFATYYGINVAGIRGLAPILVAEIDSEGSLIRGRIVSAEQLRPAGPTPDSGQRAYRLMRELTEQDFGGGDLVFQDDGYFLPRPAGTR